MKNKLNKQNKKTNNQRKRFLFNGKNSKSKFSAITHIVFIGLPILNMLIVAFALIFNKTNIITYASQTNLAYSLTTVLLMLVPQFIKNRFKIKIGETLEILYLLYIFFAFLLGFGFDFYVHVNMYDKVIHFSSGVLFAIMVFDFFAFYNRKNEGRLTATQPIFVSILSFCFSSTLLVLWEIYEFFVDTVSYVINEDTGSNMQRYMWENFSSIFPQGYGLLDTMIDLIVGVAGALIVAVVGFVVLRKRKKRKKLNNFSNQHSGF